METLNKSFDKRETDKSEGGTIATAELGVPSFDGWTYNGKAIPAVSVSAIIGTYFFQALSDAYAGDKKIADAKASYDAKVKAMLDGTLGQRGPTADPVTKEMRIIVTSLLKRDLSGDKFKQHVTEASATERNALLAKALEQYGEEDIRKQAESIVKARTKVAGDKVDVSALLG